MPINLRNEQEAAIEPARGVQASMPSGVVVAPAKPTAAMLAAGARAGDVTVEVAWKVYQAMIQQAG